MMMGAMRIGDDVIAGFALILIHNDRRLPAELFQHAPDDSVPRLMNCRALLALSHHLNPSGYAALPATSIFSMKPLCNSSAVSGRTPRSTRVPSLVTQ